MSLLKALQQPDIRDRFNQTFSKPKLTLTPPLLAPPLTKNYALVGRAFDYLLRFQIKAFNPHAIERGWVAQNALYFLKCNAQTRLYDQAYLFVTEATEHYTDFLQTQTLTETLIVSTLRLAKLEAIYRSKKIDPTLDQIEDNDIVDLKALFASVNVEQITSPEPILLNPTFDLASQVVGGADADLVLGDALIDVKTVKEFSLERIRWLQGNVGSHWRTRPSVLRVS